MFEMTGVVKQVNATVTSERGFSRRELVIEEDSRNNWRNVVQFSFQRDNCSRLDGVAVGAHVKVSFAVNGWEWTMPSGEVKVCCKLVGIDLEDLSRQATPVPSPEMPMSATGTDEVLPF